MTTINLKDFYYWYLTDELVEVPDEVAEELMASKRREAAHAERVRYNKAYYSLDCDDGIEYSACLHEPSPQELMDRKELFFRLWNALNSLPEIQGRRVDAHLILGKSYRQIALEEGVDKSAVRCSVKCGIERMKKYLRKISKLPSPFTPLFLVVCERKFSPQRRRGGRRPPPPLLWGSAAAEYGCLMTGQENERGAPRHL